MGLFDFLFGSSEPEVKANPITVNMAEYSWSPEPNEQILVAHENCQILTNGGHSTASFQHFICCVTNKRIILVPMSKGGKKYAIKLIGSLLDVGFVGKRYLTKEFCDKYVNHPIFIDKGDVTKIEIYTEIPTGKIVLIETIDFYILLGTPSFDYSADITVSFNNPHIFM